MEYRDQLGHGIEYQPEPEDPLRTAQAGADLVSRTFQLGGWSGQIPYGYAFSACATTFTPAVGGTHFLAIVAQSPIVAYTLHVTVH
jgi:hypothetical protein